MGCKVKKIFFIIILSTFNVGAVPLDSLVAHSKMLEHKAKNISGFFPHTKYMPSIPLKEKPVSQTKNITKTSGDTIVYSRLDTISKNSMANQSKSIIYSEEKNIPVPLSQSNVNNDITVDLINRITNNEVGLAKVTVVLESLQKQSESHTDNSDFNLKLIELLLGAVGAIVTSLLSSWFQDRKKPKEQ